MCVIYVVCFDYILLGVFLSYVCLVGIVYVMEYIFCYCMQTSLCSGYMQLASMQRLLVSDGVDGSARRGRCAIKTQKKNNPKLRYAYL